MPKSDRYRRQGPTGAKTIIAFTATPPAFQAADNAWILTAPTVRTTVVRHPRWDQEPWTHTLTYEFSVSTATHGMRTLRGHVHYDDQNNYAAGPGYFWISGVTNHDARTPALIVQRFADQAELYEEAMGMMNIAV
jgi:hypothetical protein